MKKATGWPGGFEGTLDLPIIRRSGNAGTGEIHNQKNQNSENHGNQQTAEYGPRKVATVDIGIVKTQHDQNKK